MSKFKLGPIQREWIKEMRSGNIDSDDFIEEFAHVSFEEMACVNYINNKMKNE